MLFDDKGRIAAIRHHWRFDEGFSAYALQGLDTDRDGKYSPQELEPLAKENVESLKDFDFFTFLSVGDYQAGFSAPKDYHLDLMDDRLLLHFTLPLVDAASDARQPRLEVDDPEYYVAFSLPSIEAVRLVDAPAGVPARRASGAGARCGRGGDARRDRPRRRATCRRTCRRSPPAPRTARMITCGAPVPPASAA